METSHLARRLACDLCHQKKSRCVRPTGQGRCHRCLQQNVQCTFSPPAKTGRPPNSRNRSWTNQQTDYAFRSSSHAVNIEVPEPPNDEQLEESISIQENADILSSYFHPEGCMVDGMDYDDEAVKVDLARSPGLDPVLDPLLLENPANTIWPSFLSPGSNVMNVTEITPYPSPSIYSSDSSPKTAWHRRPTIQSSSNLAKLSVSDTLKELSSIQHELCEVTSSRILPTFLSATDRVIHQLRPYFQSTPSNAAKFDNASLLVLLSVLARVIDAFHTIHSRAIDEPRSFNSIVTPSEDENFRRASEYPFPPMFEGNEVLTSGFQVGCFSVPPHLSRWMLVNVLLYHAGMLQGLLNSMKDSLGGAASASPCILAVLEEQREKMRKARQKIEEQIRSFFMAS